MHLHPKICFGPSSLIPQLLKLEDTKDSVLASFAGERIVINKRVEEWGLLDWKAGAVQGNFHYRIVQIWGHQHLTLEHRYVPTSVPYWGPRKIQELRGVLAFCWNLLWCDFGLSPTRVDIFHCLPSTQQKGSKCSRVGVGGKEKFAWEGQQLWVVGAGRCAPVWPAAPPPLSPAGPPYTHYQGAKAMKGGPESGVVFRDGHCAPARRDYSAPSQSWPKCRCGAP